MTSRSVPLVLAFLIPLATELGPWGDKDWKAAEEAKKMDLYTVTFHKRLYGVICKDGGLRVDYCGPLATPRMNRLQGGPAFGAEYPSSFLIWAVTVDNPLISKPGVLKSGELLFVISISLQKEADTVVTWESTNTRFFVRVTEIAKGRTLDTPLPEVGEKGMTIRKLLERLAAK